MGDMWKGGLDEVVLHDRALSADEVAARSRTYLPKGIMRSEIIRLPDVMLWDDLGYRCSLPEGTHIEISVHDGNTGELMFTHTASEPGEAVDLTSVNPLLYRSLFLSASFSSGQTATPILHNWSVSWKAPSAPEVLKEGGPITILEDTLSVGILDLGEYFHDRHTDLGAPGYGLSYISGRDRVGLNVSGSLVGVDWMVDNWTGTVLFSAACTNVFNLTSPPVDFELMVTNVNDAPVLTGISPEDGSTVAEREQTLHWKVLDVDNSSDEVTCDLYFGSTVPPPLVGRGLTAEHWDTGELDDGITYYWNLSCSDGLSTVEPVSGAWSFTVDTSVNVPKTILIAPMNGSVINTTTVNLGWDVKGTGDNSTKFHIFLGAGNSSLSRLAVVNGSTYTLEDLPDNTEYRWKVVPVSGSLEGVCASGTWTFRIDTKGEPYEPEGQMFKMWLEPSYITMLAGDAEEVNVLLYSYAEAALPVRLKVSGILSEYAHIEENIVLEHGWRNITLNLSPPADVETGLYKLNVNISYGNVTLGETLFAYVEGNGTGGDIGGTEDPDPGGPGINWFCIIPFIILVIMVVVIAVYIRIGKEPTEEYAEPRRVMEYGRRPARGIPPHPVGVVSAPPERRVAPVMAERAFPESSPAPTSRQQASPAEEGKEEKEMEKGMKEEERKATGEWELDLSEGEPEMKNVESIVISEPRAHRMPVKTSADDLLEDIGSELARRYREENSKDGGAPDPNGPDLNELDLAGLDLD